jgi:hypothetical protein
VIFLIFGVFRAVGLGGVSGSVVLYVILSGTLRIKAYRIYTKRTLRILRYRHLRTLIGL